jgi:hypothetical protein
MSRIFLFLILLIFISCDNLPDDLQVRKDEVNLKIDELLLLEKTASNITDYQTLVENSKSIKSEVIDYTEECNSRGYEKENSKILYKLSTIISKYEKLIELENSKINENSIIEEDYTESTSNDEDYYSNSKCSNCGMGRYNSNGICDMCNSASPSRVEESYSNQYESCLACNATGWRDDKICNICNGKGKYMPY